MEGPPNMRNCQLTSHFSVLILHVVLQFKQTLPIIHISPNGLVFMLGFKV